MSNADRILLCRECGSEFTFTAGEQAFYASRGLLHPPSRCPGCRSARRPAGPAPAEGYVKYGPFASFGGATPRQMHPATCSGCGQMTEVPFLPRDDRPVYCRDCYSERTSRPQEPGRPGAEGHGPPNPQG